MCQSLQCKTKDLTPSRTFADTFAISLLTRTTEQLYSLTTFFRPHSKHDMSVVIKGSIIAAVAAIIAAIIGAYFSRQFTLQQTFHITKDGINVKVEVGDLVSRLQELTEVVSEKTTSLEKARLKIANLEDQSRLNENKLQKLLTSEKSCEPDNPPPPEILSPGWLLDVYTYEELPNLPQRPPNSPPLSNNIATKAPPVFNYGEFLEQDDIKSHSDTYYIGQYWHGVFNANITGNYLFVLKFKSENAFSNSGNCQVSLLENGEVRETFKFRIFQSNNKERPKDIRMTLEKGLVDIGVWMICDPTGVPISTHPRFYSSWKATLNVKKPGDSKIAPVPRKDFFHYTADQG